MIKSVWVFLWLFAFGVSPQEETVHGKWKVVFTYHITNGKRSEGSPPLMDAFWTFRPDGTYLVEAGIRETGKYTVTDNHLVMDSDKPLMPDLDIRTYRIEKHDGRSLTLSIPIMETADFSMVNYVDFTKAD